MLQLTEDERVALLKQAINRYRDYYTFNEDVPSLARSKAVADTFQEALVIDTWEEPVPNKVE